MRFIRKPDKIEYLIYLRTDYRRWSAQDFEGECNILMDCFVGK